MSHLCLQKPLPDFSTMASQLQSKSSQKAAACDLWK